MSSGRKILSAVEIRKSFKSPGGGLTEVLKGASLDVFENESVSISGESGAGKTTFLNIAAALESPDAGEVHWLGRRIDALSNSAQSALRAEFMGFVFQNFHLIPSLNVTDNVELPLLYGHVPASERKGRVEEVLERVGLSHRAKHFPAQLSGGQCQRVAIARAIVGRPELILADEPTGNLDSRMGEEIMNILLQLNQGGVTIIMVTHDERIAAKTGRIVRLLDGELV